MIKHFVDRVLLPTCVLPLLPTADTVVNATETKSPIRNRKQLGNPKADLGGDITLGGKRARRSKNHHSESNQRELQSAIRNGSNIQVNEDAHLNEHRLPRYGIEHESRSVVKTLSEDNSRRRRADDDIESDSSEISEMSVTEMGSAPGADDDAAVIGDIDAQQTGSLQVIKSDDKFDDEINEDEDELIVFKPAFSRKATENSAINVAESTHSVENVSEVDATAAPSGISWSIFSSGGQNIHVDEIDDIYSDWKAVSPNKLGNLTIFNSTGSLNGLDERKSEMQNLDTIKDKGLWGEWTDDNRIGVDLLRPGPMSTDGALPSWMSSERKYDRDLWSTSAVSPDVLVDPTDRLLFSATDRPKQMWNNTSAASANSTSHKKVLNPPPGFESEDIVHKVYEPLWGRGKSSNNS